MDKLKALVDTYEELSLSIDNIIEKIKDNLEKRGIENVNNKTLKQLVGEVININDGLEPKWYGYNIFFDNGEATNGMYMDLGSVASIDKKVYVFHPKGASTDVYEYNFENNTYLLKSSYDKSFKNATSQAINGKVYLIGGHEGGFYVRYSDTKEYNPITETWTDKANISKARRNHVSAVYNDKIYIFGGTDGTYNIQELEIYSPLLDTWTLGIKQPSSLTEKSGICFIDDKVYLVGGSAINGNVGNALQEYDFKLNTWTLKKNWVTVTNYPVVLPGENKLYVLGGSSSDGSTNSNSIACEYSIENNTWKNIQGGTLNLYLCYSKTVKIDDTVLLFGGRNSTGTYTTKVNLVIPK